MSNEKIIEYLYLVMKDIELREDGKNCLSILTWNELCNMGIDLFNQLKRE